MSRRFQYIMTAMLNQAAADKDNVTNSINTAKFADSVDQKQWIMRPFPLDLQQAGTQTCLEPILTSQFCYFVSTCNLARCDNQSCFRIDLTNFRKSFKKSFFFGRVSTAGHNNRKTVFNTQFFFITS